MHYLPLCVLASDRTVISGKTRINALVLLLPHDAQSSPSLSLFLDFSPFVFFVSLCYLFPSVCGAFSTHFCLPRFLPSPLFPGFFLSGPGSLWTKKRKRDKSWYWCTTTSSVGLSPETFVSLTRLLSLIVLFFSLCAFSLTLFPSLSSPTTFQVHLCLVLSILHLSTFISLYRRHLEHFLAISVKTYLSCVVAFVLLDFACLFVVV